MSNALSAGVSGLQAHQRMLDVAGNNLANVNTTAFKASSVHFSELFSQSLVNASGPTANTGGTNPQQSGSGVGIASIARDTTQGNIVKTGNPLDAGIEGNGYFVLSDGEQNVYTRSGTFSVDARSNLVDKSTGYRVQRFGTVGETDNFQTAGINDITVPYDQSVEPNATSVVTLAGNLSADQSLPSALSQVISSENAYTTNSGSEVSSTTLISALDQFTGTYAATTSHIRLSGFTHDGTTIESASGLGYLDVSLVGLTTLGDMNGAIETAMEAYGTGTDVTVEISNGRIKITDTQSGYSEMDVRMSWVDAGGSSLTMPTYFEMNTVGGTEVKDVNIPVYDHQGTKYTMTGAFVRTNTINHWDFVLTGLTGPAAATVDGISIDGRRISGLTFNEDTGAYAGLSSTSESSTLAIDFGATGGAQTINLNFGTAGLFSGITQVAGASTVVATDQDGYPKGDLSSVSIDSEGNIVGTFTNGIRKNVAAIQMALFDNPEGLDDIGKGFFITSGNSGEPTSVQALTRGAGKIHGSALEKSNADVANEFVSLIQAQNGYQANARTIRVANDILQELANLVR